MKGYAGKVLHVDLTAGTFEVETPDEKFYREYIGGACMGAYYVLHETPKGADPLGPDNVLAFTVGPLAGSRLVGAARHCVAAKSPLTGGIMVSEGGGYWAPEFKWTGFDAVVLKGRAEKPCYLWLHDGAYELCDASAIWGKDTKEAQRIIRETHGDNRIRVAQCGPAGERGCLYANVGNELGHFNGRGGMGAVMGSKNLRAIAVRGRIKPDFFDNDGINAYAKKWFNDIVGDPALQGFKGVGTHGVVDAHVAIGGLPTKNWTTGVFQDQSQLESTAWDDLIVPGTCFGCPISCKRSIDPKKTDEIDADYGGPEYETVGMCGSNLGIGDRVAISKINAICAQYGMDTISLGATLSFLIECYETGLIDETYTEGWTLRFGDADTMIRLAGLAGRVEGFGKKIALGSARLAKEIGRGSEKLLLTVKGKEMPAHMPHAKASLGLSYALCPNGADHVSHDYDPAIAAEPLSESMLGLGFDRTADPLAMTIEKAKLFYRTQLIYGAIDSVSACMFAYRLGMGYDMNDMITCLRLATGWRTNLYEMMLVGERRLQLMRAFNIREGFTSADDVLPEKMFTPLTGGVSDGQALDRTQVQEVIDFYYELAGWTGPNGVPSKARLLLLNLDWVSEIFYM